ncbi:hypothetical protein CR513_46925, partial [Mucuna pruriens]
MGFFSENGSWDDFIDILGLAIYGIILLPRLNDYIDLVAIDVFLASRGRGKNPVTTVLANTYYTIHYCHEKKGGQLVCYLQALYLWLIAHTFTSKCMTLCPMEDFKWCWVKRKIGREWTHILRNLTNKSIQEVLYQYGRFWNVPLVGTQGCINYNSVILLKQSGYLMLQPPSEESITPLIVHGLESPNVEILRKIRLAWENVNRRGRDLGPRSHDVLASYRNWIQVKVRMIKLPFNGPLLAASDSSRFGNLKNKRMDESLEVLVKMKKEEESLKRKLEEAYEGQRMA